MTRVNFRNSVALALALLLTGCGGGGGGAPSISNISASYSPDGATKTVTTTYSNGTVKNHQLQSTNISYSYNADGSQRTPTYSYSDGSTHVGATQTPNSITFEYNSDGSQRTLIYLYSDGSRYNGASEAGTLSTPLYSSDGSQKTLVYIFSDGTSHNGATLSGNAATSWATDHISRTITYTFTDGTQNAVNDTVQPVDVKPSVTAALYPADWSTGNSTGPVTAPVTSARKKLYGDGYSEVLENGSVVRPFLQETLAPIGSANPIRDPNGYVTFTADPKPINNNTATSMTFDLHWGTPDPKGPEYVGYYKNGDSLVSYHLPNSIFVFERTLSGPSSSTITSGRSGPIFFSPTDEIINAWQNGWTGKGTNILVWDNLFASPIDSHPATVWSIAHLVAWGSNFYGKSYDDRNSRIIQQNGDFAQSDVTIKFHVINMSFGMDREGYFKNNPNANEEKFRTAAQEYTVNKMELLKNSTYSVNSTQFDFHDAVITKAAGNDRGKDAQYEPLTYYLAHNVDINKIVTANSEIVNRLLVVGALTETGTTDKKSDIAFYSNVAGDDLLIQSRFLYASGTVPFYAGDVIYGSSIISGFNNNVGTSYAAPRVAGYVAIVRQKFPNLTAPNTADILLATARYDTLTCYPNCDKAIYGQGEASLSRALAPVGYLR